MTDGAMDAAATAELRAVVSEVLAEILPGLAGRTGIDREPARTRHAGSDTLPPTMAPVPVLGAGRVPSGIPAGAPSGRPLDLPAATRTDARAATRAPGAGRSPASTRRSQAPAGAGASRAGAGPASADAGQPSAGASRTRLGAGYPGSSPSQIRPAAGRTPSAAVSAPSGPGAGPGESWTVALDSDDDLDAFVRRILKLADNPKARQDLIAGRARFRLAGRSVPIAATPAHRVERGAVTERAVGEAARLGARLVLGRRAVLTPLARDKARALGVPIEKER